MVTAARVPNVADLDEVIPGLGGLERDLRVGAEPLGIVAVDDLAAILRIDIEAGIERRPQPPGQHFERDPLVLLGLELEEVAGQVLDHTINCARDRDRLRGLESPIPRRLGHGRQVIHTEQLQIAHPARRENADRVNPDRGIRLDGQIERDLARLFAVLLTGGERGTAGDGGPKSRHAVECTALNGDRRDLARRDRSRRDAIDLRGLGLGVDREHPHGRPRQKQLLDQSAKRPDERYTHAGGPMGRGDWPGNQGGTHQLIQIP